MTRPYHNDGKASKRSWVVAHAIAEVLGIRSSDARSWVKHWRRADLPILGLMEGDDPGLIVWARKVMEDVLANGRVVRGWLGVSVQNASTRVRRRAA